MEKKIHVSKNITAVGPYSTAVEAGGFIFISGQLAINPQNGESITDIKAAAIQALTNINTILNDMGLEMRNIIKTTIYLKNMEDFPTFNKIYADFFPNDPPARSTIEVSNLPKNSLLEIEAIAKR